MTSANEARNDDSAKFMIHTLFHIRTPNLRAEAERYYFFGNLSLKVLKMFSSYLL